MDTATPAPTEQPAPRDLVPRDGSYDFQAVDKFGFADSDIECQGSTPTPAAGGAVVLDEMGDPVTASNKVYDKRTDWTATYKCNSVTGVTGKTFILGGSASRVATQISIRWNATGHCEITINGHEHESSNHQAENAYTVTLPSLGFGALDPVSSTPNTACQAATWSAAILNHRDRVNNTGRHLVGASRGCRIDASAEFLGAAGAIGAGWIKDGPDTDPNTDNADFGVSQRKVYKFQAPD